MSHEQHRACIEACVRCAEDCEHCATACLGESTVAELAACIRLDLDCSAACWGAAAFMSRDSQFTNEVCALCAEICDACGAECRKHDMDHCHRCADACEACSEACRRMVGAAA